MVDAFLYLKGHRGAGLCRLLSGHCVAQKTGGKQIWAQSKKRCFQLSCESSIAEGVYLFRVFKKSISWHQDQGRNSILTIRKKPKGGLQADCALRKKWFRKGHTWTTKQTFPGPSPVSDSTVGSFTSSTSLLFHHNLSIFIPILTRKIPGIRKIE